MQTIDKRVFRVVSVVHATVILVLFCYGFLSGCFRRPPDRVIPVEFLVDVRPAAPAPVPDPPMPAPVPDPPEPAPTPPAPRPPREIQINTNRVVRQARPRQAAPVAASPNPLSAEEIARLLSEGATASDRTSIPDADGRGLALIRKTLYAAWEGSAPARAAVGDAEATLELQLGAGGLVQAVRLIGPSGSPELDASVLQVAERIGRIHGLPPGFVERRPRVTITFSVE